MNELFGATSKELYQEGRPLRMEFPRHRKGHIVNFDIDTKGIFWYYGWM